MTIATLGILTSGGDCAGLNAVIRAATDAAVGRGWRVLGLRNGHLGLLANPPDILPLTADAVRGDLLRAGGTILGTTTKGDPFAFPDADGTKRDRSAEVLAAIRALGLDAIVVIGGDGSMRLFDRLLTPAGIPWVGVPKTIDNDVPGTEFAVGFFTAVEVVGQALDRLASTAASHRRIMVTEVMGRDSGYLALFGGIAGGADAILMPEFAYDLDAVAAHVRRVTHDRPSPVLVVVAEGIKRPAEERRLKGSVGTAITEGLQSRTGFDARCTVLGHVQRGGSPVMFDRLLGSAFGARAVHVLAAGESSRMVAWRGGLVTDIPMTEVTTGPSFVRADSQLMRTARRLGTYVGGAVTTS
ncbi:MAG: ATP-dependent 6-phosphofructokinase [Rhodospirillaceae bacterium]|nr:MAG: ATP-dependent 6-phosphofructokinase [Rhodospirillaceae bacterium]